MESNNENQHALNDVSAADASSAGERGRSDHDTSAVLVQGRNGWLAAAVEADAGLNADRGQQPEDPRDVHAAGGERVEADRVVSGGDMLAGAAGRTDRPELHLPYRGLIGPVGSNSIRGDFVFPDAAGGDLLRITPTSFIFKGEEIIDAGKAYDAFTLALNLSLGRIGGGGGSSAGSNSGAGGGSSSVCGHGGGVVLDPHNAIATAGVGYGGNGASLHDRLPRGSVSYQASSPRQALFDPRLAGINDVPLGRPMECVIGMGKIRIYRYMDDWMQSLATEKEILPLMSEVRKYVEDMAPVRYSVEQMASLKVVNDIGGKYGTGYVVIMDGHVIARLSGPILPPLDGEDA